MGYVGISSECGSEELESGVEVARAVKAFVGSVGLRLKDAFSAQIAHCDSGREAYLPRLVLGVERAIGESFPSFERAFSGSRPRTDAGEKRAKAR